MSDVVLIHEVHDMWPSTLIEIGGMSETNPFVKVIQLAENSAYSKSDKVVSIPPYAESYMKQHGLKDGKFVNIPNGIAAEDWEDAKEIPGKMGAFFESLQKDGKFIVGYFGGHALSNALDALLDCARLFVENDNIMFVLVGKGVEKERLMQRCKEEQIGNVAFLDAIEKRCIPSLLKWFDCIYMGAADSSLYRFGLGLNKFYDAMMAGKPIVLSATAPMTIVEQYHCGVVVPAGDVPAIKEAIETVYHMEKTERDVLGRNGQKAVQEHFLYDKLAEDFQEAMGSKEKKKILLIDHYAGSPEMGMEFRPYYFAKEWVKAGNRVDILAGDYSHLRIKNPKVKKDFEEEVIDGVHYHWIRTGTYEGNGVKRALTMFRFVWKLWLNAKKIARKFEPDVIITSSTYPLDTYAGQRIKKLVEKRKGH